MGSMRMAALAGVFCLFGGAARAQAPTPTPPAPTAPAPTAAAAAGVPAPSNALERAAGKCPEGQPGCAAELRVPPANPPMTLPPLPKAPAVEDGKQPAKPEAKDEPMVTLGSPAVNAPGGLAGAAAVPKSPIQLSGFVIMNGSWVQEDPQELSIGRNNGFFLSEARLEVTGRVSDTAWVFLSLDGAVATRQADNSLQGKNVVDLKDAYAVWAPVPHLRVQLGQFKAPQDVEQLLEETEVRFPTRSLVTAGLDAPQGFAAAPLALGRQLGVGVGSDQVTLPFGWITGQVMVSNGNGPNALFNDTKLPSLSGRVALGLLGWAVVGVDGYYQPRATGTQLPLYRDDLMGFGADLRVDQGPAHVMALVQSRLAKHLSSGAPSEQSLGFSVEAGWRFLGFVEPVARYHSLDPSDLVPSFKVSQLDLGLNFYAPHAPVRMSIVFAHRMEETARQLTNDGVDLSLQARF